jgi:membrane-associated phospholipid phosphatase
LRRSTIICVLFSVLLGGSASPARAEGPHELRHDVPVDVAATSLAGVAWVTSELLKPVLVGERCRWCYRGEDGSDRLNPVDRSIRGAALWEEPRTADTVSSVLGFVVEPVAVLGLTAAAAGYDKGIGGFPLDALLVLEATFIAADVNQLVKFAVARERPFVHYLPHAPGERPAATASPSDDNLSFFSGHTTLVFALATSAGTISSLRDYRLAPVVWAAGLSMAASVGYLRIAADKHYFSDVMTGAVVGSLVGIGVPLLFHSRSPSDTTAPGTTGQPLSGPPVRSAFSVSGAF